ncbi:hypothetical protein IRW98_004798, partial [Escherichia coli]|nr:hypothetical protein [Escherichia coli]
MNIPMYFFDEIEAGHYQITECYRIGVVNKKWDVCPDLFMDILNPTREELFSHDLCFGQLPPPSPSERTSFPHLIRFIAGKIRHRCTGEVAELLAYCPGYVIPSQRGHS